MVTLDLDHPDIEEYIDWKLSEEEKVSALVIGSNLLQAHANEIMSAIWNYDGEGDKLDMNVNSNLKKAAAKAIKNHVPNSHVKRFLDLASLGWKSIHFDSMDTDWQGEGTALSQVKIQTIRLESRTPSWMRLRMMACGTFTTEQS